jgi:hypothetical protein
LAGLCRWACLEDCAPDGTAERAGGVPLAVPARRKSTRKGLSGRTKRASNAHCPQCLRRKDEYEIRRTRDLKGLANQENS